VAQLLTVGVRVERGVPVLKVDGELALSGSVRILNAIRRHLGPGVKTVILDMSDVERISASALGALSEINHSLTESGCRLVLAGPGMQVRKMLVLSFLDKVIGTAGSVEEALGGV